MHARLFAEPLRFLMQGCMPLENAQAHVAFRESIVFLAWIVPLLHPGDQNMISCTLTATSSTFNVVTPLCQWLS